MKKYTVLMINALKTFCILSVLVSPVTMFAYEQIRSYDVDLEVHKDGTVTVTEGITYDFGDDQRHGIFRYVPTDHPQGDTSIAVERYVDVSLQNITMDGAAVQYEVEAERDQIYVKIGDPNVTISGRHFYEIEYEVQGGLSYYDDGAVELYWDAISPQWEVPIRDARVTLRDPDRLFLGARSCYRGTVGEQGSCGSTVVEGAVAVFTGQNLVPKEGITVAQALNSSKVTKVVLERNKVALFWIPALLIWFAALVNFVYRYRTEYKADRTTIPQYEPYKNVKPMYTGLLFDGRLDPKDITACIVHLAREGYLKIKKIDTKVLFFFEVDDYEIGLQKEVAQITSAFQKEVLKLLFGSAPVVGDTVTLGTLKSDSRKQRENQKVLQELKKNLEQDLEDSGFFQINIPAGYFVGGVVAIIALFWIFGGLLIEMLSGHLLYVGIGAIGTFIILLFMYRRRTTEGYEALWHLEGFKQFLSVTEKGRYEFHNAPEKSPEQFMEYLPYAIAFGVEDKWAKVFKDITIPDPEWYDGGGVEHFSAINFTQSIGAFSTAFVASSGSSASSGGGSVGGGGGGGGGGSW